MSIALLAIVGGGAQSAIEPPTEAARMSKGNVLALYEMKLSKEQADAMAPLIHQAVEEITAMLKGEIRRAHALPNQDDLKRKARVIFNRYDAQADAILEDEQWPAYVRFKLYAVQRICGAGFEVSGLEDGPGVKLRVVPKPRVDRPDD